MNYKYYSSVLQLYLINTRNTYITDIQDNYIKNTDIRSICTRDTYIQESYIKVISYIKDTNINNTYGISTYIKYIIIKCKKNQYIISITILRMLNVIK